MPEFTLPSGRVVETHQPLLGEYIHIVATTHENMEELIYAKFAAIVPGLTREEVATLSGDDGRALLQEVGQIWDGRSEEATLPLNNGGPQSFTASNLER